MSDPTPRPLARWRGAIAAFCVFFAAGLGLFVLGLGGGGVQAIRPRQQPYAFNHKIHTAKADCVLCHQGVRTRHRAGLPDLALCQTCHRGAPGKAPTAEQAALWAGVAKGEVPPWNRLYRVPSHVFFSHRRHVTVAALKCESCHGDMKHRETPPRYTLMRLKMRDCIACHEEKKVTVDCTACHR